MENIVIYSHEIDLQKLHSILEIHFGKIKTTTEGEVTSYTATIDKGIFSSGKTLTFNIRQRQNPDYELTTTNEGITRNLAGMSNLVNQIPLEDTTLKTTIIAKISTVNTEIGVIAKPSFVEKFKNVVPFITDGYDAIVFSGNNSMFPQLSGNGFFNKKLELLTDFQGNSDSDVLEVNISSKIFEQKNKLSTIPGATPAQIERKAIVESILRENEIKVNENLPCLPDANDVTNRSQQTVLERAKALLLVALKSEGTAMNDLLGFANAFEILPHLTPAEKAYFYDENPDEQTKTNFLWRYESFFVLFWALGFDDELHYPNGICNVQKIVGKFVELGNDGLQKQAKLRDKKTLVDQWDLAYRSHWACVDARLNGNEAPGNLMPSVVYERHYALNWLNGYMQQDWDNVQTPT